MTLREEQAEVLVDPSGLSAAQKAGRACVVCGKRWPSPQVRIGRAAKGGPLYACTDDAPLIVQARPKAGSAAGPTLAT
ncbi:hypothetical protein [Actinomadura macrotermitis]|uniref:Uncharacterized protein n=1 Tax=Actinomadura macrotermitis TaxID=2585200 RepID=A0A7K0BM27_9ACTN|nr:hypothetical protein [Actinomadura macrotermitis]MQY02225.1 hypothetical protein [Actinomadura macrotermitis]